FNWSILPGGSRLVGRCASRTTCGRDERLARRPRLLHTSRRENVRPILVRSPHSRWDRPLLIRPEALGCKSLSHVPRYEWYGWKSSALPQMTAGRISTGSCNSAYRIGSRQGGGDFAIDG